MRYMTEYYSPIGPIYLVSDGTSLLSLQFEDAVDTDHPCESIRSDLPVFDEVRNWFDIYFSGSVPAFTPPLLMNGSSFQKEVWDILLNIPYGQTASYGSIAKQLAAKRSIPRMSAQAVGNAVGKNPIPIIVPCHRVIGADGSLTGYAGGLDKKSFLLSLENNTFKNSAYL